MSRMMGITLRGGCVCLILAAGGCASLVSSTQSEVSVRTNPENARCELRGQDEYVASVTTPATLSIPNAASPVTVTCVAAGYRPTSYSLYASADGWIWGNSAFMLATGGIAVLGALVDETRSAGKAYEPDVQYDLTPDRPRPVRLRSRDGNMEMDVLAR